MRSLIAAAVALFALPLGVRAQVLPIASDTVAIRIQDTDLGTAIQILGRYLDRPIVNSSSSTARVTLETPRAIPRHEVLRLLRGLVDSHGLEFVDDSVSGIYRIRARSVPRIDQSQPGTAQRRPDPESTYELFVVPLKHARAVDVARTIGMLFGVSRGDDAASAARPGTLSAELRQNLVPPEGTPLPDSRVPAVRQSATLIGSLTVVPDAKANTLLLRATRTHYDLVHSLIEQIDVRPLQVLIEVLIAEVRRDRSLGISVEGLVDGASIPGTNMTVAGAIGSQGLGDFVLQVMGIGGVDAEATLTLSARNGDVRILSRPVILATNNESASILVGSQRPFVQVQRALPTDGATRDQIVQYKEVGTRLTVMPSISEDGTVHLDVTQEVSNATAETAFDAPVISTRSVQTQLLVRDGQTAVLGGLADRQREVNRVGLPVLSSIPLIGGLFGSNQRRTTETELFVFITPRVVRSDEDAARVTTPLRDRIVPPER
jgi:general secretion pathway protein D